MKTKWLWPVLAAGMTFVGPAGRADGTFPRAADSGTTSVARRMKWFEEHLKLKRESAFRALQPRLIGPTENSGRITDIAAVRGRPYEFYCSAASGGVWKTTNNGTTWNPIWDDGSTAAVGDIAVSESDPDTVWIGSGEANCRWWSYSGTGVYKSTDGGRTWTGMGLGDSHTIGRIEIDPVDPERVYVAAMGHMHTRNEERGVFKTSDGGRTWKKVLYVDAGTGAVDLAIDPSDRSILYAATWERIRRPWRITEYGPGSGIYKSEDGGESWRRLGKGLPSGPFVGRIGLDVSRSNPNVIYAIIDNHGAMSDPRALKRAERQTRTLKLIIGAEVYRSDDKGSTWRKVNTDDISDLYHIPFNYGFYFGQIRVAPDREDEVFILGAPLFHSTDGGKTFSSVTHPALYADHHAMWIDPDRPDHVLDGNDGGLNISYDRGRTWQDIPMPLGQCYSVAVDMDVPFNVYTALQDGMSWYGSSASVPGVTEPWKRFPAGERSALAFDHSDYRTIYSTAGLNRIDRKTMTAVSIEPRDIRGELRKSWFPPLIVSPHNPRILYFGAQTLLMSLDRGDRWRVISPDLSSPDPDRQGTVHIQFGTITAISESPLRFGLIYAGTDDGNVHVTRDGGVSWARIMNGLPNDRWVSRIEASRFDEGKVYLTLNGLRNDDFEAYVYASSDFGDSWTSIAGNLPGGPVNVIREDPGNRNILYAGTDIGLYATMDGGTAWFSLSSGLPTAIVNDLVVHPRDRQLVIGTHGRSVYVLDVLPIQEWGRIPPETELHLFSIRPAALAIGAGGRAEASLHIFRKDPGPIRIEILNGDGESVRVLDFEGESGLNTVSWDLRPANSSRTVTPGSYAVVVTAGELRARGVLDVRS